MDLLGYLLVICAAFSSGFAVGFWLRGRPLPPYTELS